MISVAGRKRSFGVNNREDKRLDASSRGLTFFDVPRRLVDAVKTNEAFLHVGMRYRVKPLVLGRNGEDPAGLTRETGGAEKHTDIH